jgi:acetyl esterase
MALHPQLMAMVKKASRQKRMHEAPLDLVRSAAPRILDSGVPREGVASIEDLVMDNAGHTVPLRVYRPDDHSGLPLILFFHGGGFTLCSIETHDGMCRQICNRSQAVVVSVDYALAPERPYPAAIGDCRAATLWAVRHAGELGANASRLGLCGDSAGGNLGIAVARSLEGAAGLTAKALALLYPVTDHYSAGHPSYVEHGSGCGLTGDEMRWLWDNYLPDATLAADLDVSPLRADDLARLPATYIATAEYDVLRDEGIAFAARLSRAGVPVVHRHYADMNHGFLNWVGVVGRAAEAMDDLGGWLRANL